jgi:hypothetical protein
MPGPPVNYADCVARSPRFFALQKRNIHRMIAERTTGAEPRRRRIIGTVRIRGNSVSITSPEFQNAAQAWVRYQQ